MHVNLWLGEKLAIKKKQIAPDKKKDKNQIAPHKKKDKKNWKKEGMEHSNYGL